MEKVREKSKRLFYLNESEVLTSELPELLWNSKGLRRGLRAVNALMTSVQGESF